MRYKGRLLPDGYFLVKTVFEKMAYELGIDYFVQEVSIVENADREFFIREYRNSCAVGANGRPCTSEYDYGYPVIEK